jgi:hypothetical protein
MTQAIWEKIVQSLELIDNAFFLSTTINVTAKESGVF